MKSLSVALGALLLATGCGQTTKPATTAPTIGSFTATPSTLPAGGGSVTLAWSVTGATALSISGGVGSVTPVTSGSITGTVNTTTTFTLTATNSEGMSTATATVTVAGAAGPTINSFTVTPATLTASGDVTVAWNVTGATSLTIGGPNVSPDSATPVTSGSTQFTVPESAVFALFATNANGTTAKNAVVTVGGDDAPEFDFTGATGTTYTGTWGFVEDNAVTPPPGSDTVTSLIIQETAPNVVTVNVTIDTSGTYTDWSCTGDVTNDVTPNLITSTASGGGFVCTITGDATCGSFTATGTQAFGTGYFDELLPQNPLVVIWALVISGSSTTSCNGESLTYAFVVTAPAP
jgi:hypothetical protein